MSESGTLSWQGTVAELTSEKERGVAAAAIIKRLGDPSDLTAAEIAYADGRAETEGVIALTIALDEGNGPDERADLTQRVPELTGGKQRPDVGGHLDGSILVVTE